MNDRGQHPHTGPWPNPCRHLPCRKTMVVPLAAGAGLKEQGVKDLVQVHGRGLPPGLAGASKGETTSHCSSVSSEGQGLRRGVASRFHQQAQLPGHLSVTKNGAVTASSVLLTPLTWDREGSQARRYIGGPRLSGTTTGGAEGLVADDHRVTHYNFWNDRLSLLRHHRRVLSRRAIQAGTACQRQKY